MAFVNKEVRDLLDVKIFVDTDSDIRLCRRLSRDISERGRDLRGVLKQYDKFVKPAFDSYIEPSKLYADIIVPRGEVPYRFCFSAFLVSLDKLNLKFQLLRVDERSEDTNIGCEDFLFHQESMSVVNSHISLDGIVCLHFFPERVSKIIHAQIRFFHPLQFCLPNFSKGPPSV